MAWTGALVFLFFSPVWRDDEVIKNQKSYVSCSGVESVMWCARRRIYSMEASGAWSLAPVNIVAYTVLSSDEHNLTGL